MATMAKAERVGWMDLSGAAEYLGVGEGTIRRWVRDGLLHAQRLGRTLSFRRECLDALVKRFISRAEERRLADRCTACGHMGLVDGLVQSTGRTYFKPDHTRFWTTHQSLVPMRARACPSCGHVQLYAAIGRLDALLPSAERAEEPAPVCVG